MFGGRSFDRDAQRAGEDLVDGWLEARAAQSRALAQRIDRLTATASSEAGRVSVTVGAGGAVTDLRLDESIRDRPAADTAREILTTLRAAQDELSGKASEMTAGPETAGPETAGPEADGSETDGSETAGSETARDGFAACAGRTASAG